MRDFEKMSTDEMYALWQGYLQTDWNGYDPLHQRMQYPKIAIRMTPLEIIKMADEIFVRLLKKEGYEPREAAK